MAPPAMIKAGQFDRIREEAAKAVAVAQTANRNTT
jgi:hypothetical protein